MKTAVLLYLAVTALLLAPAACNTILVADRHERLKTLVWVEGESMLPAFPVRCFVEMEICPYADLAGGDTVIFWSRTGKRFLHHRLLWRDESGRWVTRGDNNGRDDLGHMGPEEFQGRTHHL